MTKIEWKMLITVFFCIFIVVMGVLHIQKTISDAGGVKQLIIDAGKEIKEISAEIDKG